jgi:hypothetical protein
MTSLLVRSYSLAQGSEGADEDDDEDDDDEQVDEFHAGQSRRRGGWIGTPVSHGQSGACCQPWIRGLQWEQAATVSLTLRGRLRCLGRRFLKLSAARCWMVPSGWYTVTWCSGIACPFFFGR